jgi:hypothetical protein
MYVSQTATQEHEEIKKLSKDFYTSSHRYADKILTTSLCVDILRVIAISSQRSDCQLADFIG